jgi:hypothetical protein
VDNDYWIANNVEVFALDRYIHFLTMVVVATSNQLISPTMTEPQNIITTDAFSVKLSAYHNFGIGNSVCLQ